MNALEHVVQSWWLASTRLNDCAGNTLTVRVVKDALEALRLNERSGRVRHLADEELRQLASRRWQQRSADIIDFSPKERAPAMEETE